VGLVYDNPVCTFPTNFKKVTDFYKILIEGFAVIDDANSQVSYS
jgi:hypothetical protein